MTTYEWFQMWVLMVLAIRATRHYDKLKHDLFEAIKEGRNSYGSVAYRMRHGFGAGHFFYFAISF